MQYFKETLSFFLTVVSFCVCLSAVMRSTPALILSTAMESVSGLAVKHCVRTWDSSSSKLKNKNKKNSHYLYKNTLQKNTH